MPLQKPAAAANRDPNLQWRTMQVNAPVSPVAGDRQKKKSPDDGCGWREGHVAGTGARTVESPLGFPGGMLAIRASIWLRNHFCRNTIAPRRSSPTTWNEFLPMSMPIVATIRVD